jgi:hypothetical protein
MRRGDLSAHSRHGGASTFVVFTAVSMRAISAHLAPRPTAQYCQIGGRTHRSPH